MNTFVASLLLLSLALTLILASISIFVFRAPLQGSDGPAPLTRFFLVALRLAIGWHFFVEGMDKLKAPNWSSEPYLREATGPLAATFRSMAGDRLLDKLTLEKDGSFPSELDVEWQAYLNAFISHYELNDDQAGRAQTIYEQRKADTIKWLTVTPHAVQKPSAYPPPLFVQMTIPERLKEHAVLEQKLRDLEDNVRPRYGPDAYPLMRAAKADLNKWRADLKRDIDAQTAGLKTALRDVLTNEQKALEPLREPIRRPVGAWGMLHWSDFFVKWAITLVGIFLVAGFLTRTSCVLGAYLLFMFFLAMPPLPGWPESPRAEGHYLFINKNIIEMFALLTLATTRSGRWAGIDGLLHFIWPRNWQDEPSSGSLEKVEKVEKVEKIDEAPTINITSPETTYTAPENK